jgi:hypothetical protein
VLSFRWLFVDPVSSLRISKNGRVNHRRVLALGALGVLDPAIIEVDTSVTDCASSIGYTWIQRCV